jgi:hypothetical protein
MTLTAPGVLDARRCDRVPITMTGSISDAEAAAGAVVSALAESTKLIAPITAAAVESRRSLRIEMAPLDDWRACYCERLSESTAMNAGI